MTKLTNYAAMLLNQPTLTHRELKTMTQANLLLMRFLPMVGHYRLLGEWCRDSYTLMDN